MAIVCKIIIFVKLNSNRYFGKNSIPKNYNEMNLKKKSEWNLTAYISKEDIRYAY